MTIKIYEYKNCSTCKSALKFLDQKGVKYQKLSITDNPPSLAELKIMLGFLKTEGKTFKNLFNTSGQKYRELKVSELIKAGMSEGEALSLLSKNGMLIKRPFLLTSKTGLIGFHEKVWNKILK